jgi:rhodanese-related sulfurtransferase
MYDRITISDLLKIKNPCIIDIREPHEVRSGKIPTAINIPIGTLLDNCDKYLNMNERYYIYCETSLRSERACEFLKDLGYNVCLIEDGYKGWLSYNNIH